MPICKKCGVELETGTAVCPLCGTDISGGNACRKQTEPTVSKPGTRYDNLWFLEIFSFFAAAAFIIVLAVDFAYNAGLTWSKIPLIAIFFVWLFIFLIHHLLSRPYLLVGLEMLNFFVFLWFLDRFTGDYFWFFGLAFPLILTLGILFLLVILWIRSFHLSTLLSLSVGTLACGIFLLCLEMILHDFQNESFSISWSLVAFACILPVSGLFFYLQKRLNRKGSEMKKYFHI